MAIEEDPNAIEAAPMDGHTAAPGTSSAPPRDQKELFEKLIHATALSAIKSGGKVGREILDILGSISENTLEAITRAQRTADVDFEKIHNLPSELAPMSVFGTAEVNTSDLKWYSSTINTIKSRTPSLEDKLRTIKRMHVRNSSKCSELSISEVLTDVLEEAQALDLKRYLAQKKPLAEAWTNLLTEYRTSLSPYEAATQLHQTSSDYSSRGVLTNLKEIKHLSAQASSDPDTITRQALMHAESYLRGFTDDITMQFLKVTSTAPGIPMDPWTAFIANCKGVEAHLDKQRLVKAKGVGLKVHALSAPVSNSAEGTGISLPQEKEMASLKSELGQVKAMLQKLSAPTMVASGPNHHLGNQNSGYYHQQSPKEAFMISSGGDYKPRAPRMVSDQEFLVVKGKCRLCLDPSHRWEACPRFPGATPMPNLCFSCKQGAHHTRACPVKGQGQPQSGQRQQQQIGYQQQNQAYFPNQSSQMHQGPPPPRPFNTNNQGNV